MNFNKSYSIFFVLLVICLVGCQPYRCLLGCEFYVCPLESSKLTDFSKIIDKSFDDTWKALVQYVDGSFFSIDNFEKDSGLLTLSFGASNPSEFITGGLYMFSNLSRSFDGDYVDWLTQYENGKLNAKMDIIVTEVDSNKTQVTVMARYILISSIPNLFPDSTEIWEFESGRCITQYPMWKLRSGSLFYSDKRTICPTYKAEKEILDAIESL